MMTALLLSLLSLTAADNWPTPGGDANKSHHSQLTDITPGNVVSLGLAWAANLGTHRVLEATPVVIDGVLYTSGVRRARLRI